MPSRKKPREISQQDWNTVNSPELSEEIINTLRSASEAFPDLAKQAANRRGQRPQKKPRK